MLLFLLGLLLIGVLVAYLPLDGAVRRTFNIIIIVAAIIIVVFGLLPVIVPGDVWWEWPRRR